MSSRTRSTEAGLQSVTLRARHDRLTHSDYVIHARNAGLPKGREPYGNGAAVVVRDGENPSHGEGRQVDGNDRETGVSVMLQCPSSRDYPGTGEPDAVKVCVVERCAESLPQIGGA